MYLILFSGAVYPDVIVTPDPIREEIGYGNIAAALEDYLQIPASLDEPPLNRINYLFHIKGDADRLFVCDMLGKIYQIKQGKLAGEPFLDVGKALWPDFYTAGWESGVASFAFHPDYDVPGKDGYGKFYTVHSGPSDKVYSNSNTRLFIDDRFPVDHYNVIAEWSVDTQNPDRINPDSYREIMRIAQPYEVHDVGTIAFNYTVPDSHPDYGMLYISVGDGGLDENKSSIVEPNRQAQKTNSVYGKILRIDPLQDGQSAYSIPEDNPFVSNSDYLPEIWALGLRNPQRFSWDMRPGGGMFITDIGESNIEEVNLGLRGANYGWSRFEGTFRINPERRSELSLSDKKSREGYQDPVAMFDHTEGNAITGGFVYRKQGIPGLHGKYIFGDIAAGRIFYIDADQVDPSRQSEIRKLKLYYIGRELDYQDIIDNPRVNLRFGLGGNGDIYTLSKTDGMIRKMVPVRYLIRQQAEWFLFNDNFNTGSEIRFESETFASDHVSVTMIKADDPDPASPVKKYPYVGLLYKPAALANADCNNCDVIIEIDYRLTGSMELLFAQDNVAPGNEYRLQLEPSAEFITRKFGLSEFSQPDWAAQAGEPTAGKMKGIKFQLNTPESSRSEIEIRSIKLLLAGSH